MSYELVLAWIEALTDEARVRPMDLAQHTHIGIQMHTATDDIKILYPERWSDAVDALNEMWLEWTIADPDEARSARYIERAEGGWFRDNI